MPELLRIDMMKQQGDGVTSLSPQSPTTSVSTSAPVSNRMKILGGYAVYTGARVYSASIQEIKAGGNEALATTISNITIGARIIVGAVVTNGLSLIPEGINVATEIFSTSKQKQRDNREVRLNRELSGQLNGYLGGGGE